MQVTYCIYIFLSLLEFIQPGHTMEFRTSEGDTAKVFTHKHIVSNDKSDAEVYLKSSIAKRKKGNYIGAIKESNKFIRLLPDDARGYTSRGFAKKSLGKFDEANVDFSKAISLQPNEYMYLNRGLLNLDFKKYRDAILDFDKAIELDPKFTSYYRYRAECKFAVGDTIGGCLDLDFLIKHGSKTAQKEMEKLCK